MRKLFLILCITLVILFSKANVIQANDFAENTANARIAASLYMLNDAGQRDVIALLKGQNATGLMLWLQYDCRTATADTNTA